MGTPRLGQALTSAAGELTELKQPEVLGAIALEQEPPPPWEVDPRYFRHNTDARRFVKCPDNIELRWLNPKVVSWSGMRDWQKVDAKGDARFKLLNKAMAAPDNTIRKGGHDGPFLAWMYKSWVESRNKLKAAKVARHTQSAVDRQEELKHQLARGSFNQVTLDSAQHPTHTIGEGASMTD